MILVTFATDDRFNMKTIAVMDKTQKYTLSLDMTEENIEYITNILPINYRKYTIVRLDRLEDLIIIGGKIVS